MDGQGEGKTRHTAVGPDEWDGPSKKSLHIPFLDRLLVPSGKVAGTKLQCMLHSLRQGIDFGTEQKRSNRVLG